VRDKHVKDAAQDVAEDVTRDVAEGVLGAAEDGSHLLAGTCGLPPTAPHPTSPKVSSSTVSSSSRQALFERLKPFVGAAGPVTVAVDSRRAGM